MRGNELLDNIDLADATYVEAADASPRRAAWIRWVAIAACLCLLIVGGFFGGIFRSPDSPDNSIVSYFVLTAHAASGESTELALNENCFNSVPVGEQGNVFGVDMPLFDFSVSPSNWSGNEALYSQFEISISYNGTLVEGKDEHIMLAYLIPTPDSDAPWSYSIMGWFTEPTDIIISILNKESREIVETITVTVNYLPDRQEYELEVTDWNTKFAEQQKAVEASNALMEYFYSQGYVSDYPAYFGGYYIESNELHVKLVSPTDDDLNKISSVLAGYKEVVVFEYTEMSMAYLQAYADSLANELMELGYDVTEWYVDDATGNIVIGVLEKDLAAVSALMADREDNSPTIIIEKGAYVTTD